MLKMKIEKAGKVSTTTAVAGLSLASLGVALSGGFGPCGPQHPGPFFVAMIGALAFAIGILGLVFCFIVFSIRKLKSLA